MHHFYVSLVPLLSSTYYNCSTRQEERFNNNPKKQVAAYNQRKLVTENDVVLMAKLKKT